MHIKTLFLAIIFWPLASKHYFKSIYNFLIYFWRHYRYRRSTPIVYRTFSCIIRNIFLVRYGYNFFFFLYTYRIWITFLLLITQRKKNKQNVGGSKPFIICIIKWVRNYMDNFFMNLGSGLRHFFQVTTPTPSIL